MANERPQFWFMDLEIWRDAMEAAGRLFECDSGARNTRTDAGKEVTELQNMWIICGAITNFQRSLNA